MGIPGPIEQVKVISSVNLGTGFSIFKSDCLRNGIPQIKSSIYVLGFISRRVRRRGWPKRRSIAYAPHA